MIKRILVSIINMDHRHLDLIYICDAKPHEHQSCGVLELLQKKIRAGIKSLLLLLLLLHISSQLNASVNIARVARLHIASVAL